MSDIDILDTLNRLNVDYRDNGDYYKFQCIDPLHTDKHPSMTMLKKNGFSKCWSCGATYTLAQFVRELSGKNFYEFYDIKNVNEFKFKNTLKKKVELIVPERKMIIEHGQFLRVDTHSGVLQYLNSIDVNNDVIRYFDIKYVDVVKIKFLETVTKPTYLRDRIVIPVYFEGRLINLEARDYTGLQKPKVLYPKGAISDTLFNWDNIDLTKPLVVVEGMKALFRIWRYFTTNIVSTFGNVISPNQQKLLNRAQDVILFPDHDKAGFAMINMFEKFYEREYKIAMMPEVDQDPADGTLKQLGHTLENPKTSSQYFLEKYDLVPSRVKSWY